MEQAVARSPSLPACIIALVEFYFIVLYACVVIMWAA